MALIVRPRPKESESLNGFILRLSQENWFTRSGLIEDLAQIKVPQIALQNGGLDLLARHLGMKPAALEAYQYSPIDGTGTIRRFLGSEVHQSHLLTTAMRYCPVCMGVKRYHQAIWEMRMVGACPEHGVPLLSIDPVYGRPISWQRPDLLRMPWGDLPVADLNGHCATLSDDALIGQRAIFEKCGLQHDGERVLARMPDAIATMTLNDFLKVIVLLGASALNILGFSGARPVYAAGVDVLKLSASGANMLMGWPDRFYGYLEEERASVPGTSTALGKLFEKLFRRMKKLEDGPAKEFLQRATNDFLAERPISLKRKNTHFVLADDRNCWNYVSLREAAEILGVSPYWARSIAEEQGWIEAGKKNRHVPNLIPRQAVEAYSKPEPMTCSHTEAMELLGTAKSGLRAVVKYGLLIPRTNKEDCRSATRFIRSEVEGLVDRLRATTDVVGTSAGAEEVDILQLANRIAPPRHTLGLLLARVLDETLKPVRWDDGIVGIYAMRFDAGRLTEYKSAVNGAMPSTIEAWRAVRRYGYSLEELRWLVGEGQIQIATSAPTFASSTLDRRSLDDFFECHLLSTRIDVERLGVPVQLVAESADHGRVYKVQ